MNLVRLQQKLHTAQRRKEQTAARLQAAQDADIRAGYALEAAQQALSSATLGTTARCQCGHGSSRHYHTSGHTACRTCACTAFAEASVA